MKKNYVFITPSNWGVEAEINHEDLISLFHAYKAVSSVEGDPKPFVEVIEISEDFREAISNHMILEFGLTFVARHLVVIEEKKAYVLVMPMNMLEKYLTMYEKSLKTTQEKIIFNLNQITEQALQVSQFKAKYITPYKKC